MALAKYPFGRYLVIDRLLRRKDWVKTSELQQAIERELGIWVSDKTIQNDLRDMKENTTLEYYAPIEKNTSQKAWYYTDRHYTIQAFGLKDDDLNALKFYAGVIHQYKEYPVFTEFSNAIQKVLAATSFRAGTNKRELRNSIQTEYSPPMIGSEWIPEVIRALNENKKIRFIYQKYGSTEARTVDFEPYLLKEDRHRWYLLGRTKPEGNPTWTYGLDRMTELEVSAETFNPVSFDFESYYADVLGITVPDGEPLEIVMSFTPKQGKYLQTLPLHISQQELINSEEEYRVSICIKPTWEFYEKVLGYGANIRILSPRSVIDQLKEITTNIMLQYD